MRIIRNIEKHEIWSLRFPASYQMIQEGGAGGNKGQVPQGGEGARGRILKEGWGQQKVSTSKSWQGATR